MIRLEVKKLTSVQVFFVFLGSLFFNGGSASANQEVMAFLFRSGIQIELISFHVQNEFAELALNHYCQAQADEIAQLVSQDYSFLSMSQLFPEVDENNSGEGTSNEGAVSQAHSTENSTQAQSDDEPNSSSVGDADSSLPQMSEGDQVTRIALECADIKKVISLMERFDQYIAHENFTLLQNLSDWFASDEISFDEQKRIAEEMIDSRVEQKYHPQKILAYLLDPSRQETVEGIDMLEELNRLVQSISEDTQVAQVVHTAQDPHAMQDIQAAQGTHITHETQVTQEVQPVQSGQNTPEVVTDAPENQGSSAEKKDAPKKNRCPVCHKKLRNMPYTCRCEINFCAEHRYPHLHNCTFDYKANQKAKLEKENPVVISDRVPDRI